jgi:hypothetical protein
MPRDDHFEIPDPIRQAFAGRSSLKPKEIAAAFGWDKKTITEHMDAGNLPYIEKGLGKIRPRRESTLSNVITFIINQTRGGTSCQNEQQNIPRATVSVGRRARRSGAGAGSTKVANLADRRAQLIALGQKKPRP